MCFRFPWNWQRPVGYLASISVECYWANNVGFSVTCLWSFFILFSLCFDGFALDIKQRISDLKAVVVSVDHELTDPELKQRFSEIIQFHSQAKALVVQIFLLGFELQFVIFD